MYVYVYCFKSLGDEMRHNSAVMNLSWDLVHHGIFGTKG